MRIAAGHGTPTQQAGGAARLRSLARIQPAHAAVLSRLSEILAAEPPPAEAEAGTAAATTAASDG
jgi:hypothetical protein